MIMTLSATFCTIQEAASLLERSAAQVTRYCQDGKLAAEFIGDRWFIARASVDEFKKPRRGNPNWVKGYTRKKKNRKK
jgi:excisionase family DNA binding protein